MSICIKDQIQNMNIVIGCTVGCTYCYARNNVKRWHMIDDFADPEFFPGKLKMMEKKRPQNFLLTGMSDLSGWKPEWRDEVFAKIRENPQHQFLFLTKRPDLLDFDTDLENAWFGVTVSEEYLCFHRLTQRVDRRICYLRSVEQYLVPVNGIFLRVTHCRKKNAARFRLLVDFRHYLLAPVGVVSELVGVIYYLQCARRTDTYASLAVNALLAVRDHHIKICVISVYFV